MNVPKPRFISDTLASLISGLSSTKDKTQGLFYWVNELDRAQLDAMYRGDWIARKIVNIPPKDAMRQWRSWQAENSAIEAIEQHEDRLKIKHKALAAFIKARLYGGAALILGVKNTGAPDTELDLDLVKKDSLEFVHVVTRHQLSNTGMIENDLLSPYFGKPKMWSRQLRDQPPVLIHPSRVVQIIGEPLPDEETNRDAWGDSILTAIQDAVRQAGLVPQAMATTIEELKIDVLKVKGLTEQLGTQESTDLLTARMSYGMTSKSTLNTLVMDQEDEWETRQLNLAGYPDVIKMYLQIAAGAADIPVTRMLGQSPSGMNATGESDIRNYYDHIKSDQNDTYGEALIQLDEVLIRSATGTRDPDVFYEWNPLWQETELEKADKAKKKADVVKADVDMMLIPTDALTKVRQNMLIEDGFYPGLEQALEESDGEVVNPKLEAQLQMQQMKGEQALEQQEAAPPPPEEDFATDEDLIADAALFYEDYNKKHHPAGSSKGGQFAPAEGGEGGGSDPDEDDDDEDDDTREVPKSDPEEGSGKKRWPRQSEQREGRGGRGGGGNPFAPPKEERSNERPRTNETEHTNEPPAKQERQAPPKSPKKEKGGKGGGGGKQQKQEKPQKGGGGKGGGKQQQGKSGGGAYTSSVGSPLANKFGSQPQRGSLRQPQEGKTSSPIGTKYAGGFTKVGPNQFKRGEKIYTLEQMRKLAGLNRDEAPSAFIKVGPDQYRRKNSTTGKIYNYEQVKLYYARGGWSDHNTHDYDPDPDRDKDGRFASKPGHETDPLAVGKEALRRTADPFVAAGAMAIAAYRKWAPERKRQREEYHEDAFNPDQPRDDHGKWTNTTMREYTPKEMDWEYGREYEVYSKPSFPEAFESREDFQKKYDATPLTYLSPDEIGELENSMAYAGLGKDDDWLERTFGHRRDVGRIARQFDEGVPPPIILERSDGSRHLMAGQTRLAASLAKRRRLGVKVIKVNDTAYYASHEDALMAVQPHQRIVVKYVTQDEAARLVKDD